MANVPESSNFDAGIYQIETTDEVLGGASGIANKQAKGLANRTRWLKNQVDSILNSLPLLSVFDTQLLAENGYQKFPGGLIVQWKSGAFSATEESQTEGFPIVFPNKCFGVLVSTQANSSGSQSDNNYDVFYQTKSWTTAQVTLYMQWTGTSDFPENLVRPFILALGR